MFEHYMCGSSSMRIPCVCAISGGFCLLNNKATSPRCNAEDTHTATSANNSIYIPKPSLYYTTTQIFSSCGRLVFTFVYMYKRIQKPLVDVFAPPQIFRFSKGFSAYMMDTNMSLNI